MDKSQRTESSVTNKKSAILLFLVFFLMIAVSGGIIFFADGSNDHDSTNSQKTDNDTGATLADRNNGWWETTRLIYHGIPTRCVFKLPRASKITPKNIANAVWRELDRIGAIFNPFNPKSEIYRLNSHAPTDPMAVSDNLFNVLSLSRQLWKDTGGEFDPAIWQIKTLWQTAQKTQQIPSENDIADALKWTGLGQVVLEESGKNRITFKDHPVQFDFGGIVKGYAVDCVRELLMHQGVTAGLVQLGGEISTFGKNDEKPWRVGIQHPRQMDRLWGVISSESRLNVSTSGNYRQPIIIDGASFYHIFSPKTGKPVSEKVLGVTTASFDGQKSNAWLDGLATAITVAGPTAGFSMAEKLGIDVLILYENNDGAIGEFITPGLSNFYSRYTCKPAHSNLGNTNSGDNP